MVINQNIKQIMEMDFFSLEHTGEIRIIILRRKESKKKYITTFSMLALKYDMKDFKKQKTFRAI